MKKTKRSFNGPLGGLIKRHLELHRSFGSLMNGAGYTLAHFDQYLAKQYPFTKTVTYPITVNYYNIS